MFRVIANTENEFVFSTQSTVVKVWKICLKLCTYFTEEDAYLLFDRKKSGPFPTLRYVGLRLMLERKLMLSIPPTFFLNKQFETLYEYYRHTVNVYVPFYKGKNIFLQIYYFSEVRNISDYHEYLSKMMRRLCNQLLPLFLSTWV